VKIEKIESPESCYANHYDLHEWAVQVSVGVSSSQERSKCCPSEIASLGGKQ